MIGDCKVGADKVLINTEFHKNTKLISTSSKEFGSQAIVGGIDVKTHDNEYFVYHSDGTINSKKKVLDWAKFLEDSGCGEIFVNSINKDGSNSGFDLELGKKLIDSINLPIIFCGGASDEEHFMELFNLGVDAAAAANMFNYKEQSIYNVKKNLEKIIVNFISTEIEWVPLNSVEIIKDNKDIVLDFLETLEELKIQYSKLFIENGGEELIYIPCLNSQEDHINMSDNMIQQNIKDW